MHKWIMMTVKELDTSILKRYKMPVSLRPKGKGKKIFTAIMGIPINFQKRTKKERAVDRRLLFEETYRVR